MRVHGLYIRVVICVALATLAVRADIDPPNPARIALGKRLFFDTRLSTDRTLACVSCHIPALGFTNGSATAIGVHGQVGERNVPTLLNRRNSTAQFWDMRAPSLENQAEVVIASPSEMGGAAEQVATRLREDSDYVEQFRAVFGAAPSLALAAKALAAFERTLSSGEAPYDRWRKGDAHAMSAAQLRGEQLFTQKFKCASCHAGTNFSDEKLNVRCYPFTPNLPTVVSQRFKTPTLRNLKYTAPYMHNGALATLEEAVEFYNPSVHLDAAGKPDAANPGAIHISEKEKRDLVAFLKSLSAEQPFVETKN